ncbi:MAG: HNH endonuclease, partial [Pirellula sp.]
LVARQALEVARMAMIEIGHAIVDMDAKTAGYIVGAIAYEAAESAAITAILVLFGVVEVGSGGIATPAVGAGVAGIVGAKAATLARLTSKLSKLDLLKAFPKIVRAVEKLETIAVWAIKYRMCFTAGTKVHSAEGLKNIEDIKVGDLVLSRDENSPASSNEFCKVTELFRTSPNRLITLKYTSRKNVSESLTCTFEHPFCVRNLDLTSRQGLGSEGQMSMNGNVSSTVIDLESYAFIPASDLRVGDEFELADGNSAYVVEIEREFAEPGESFATYNFSVEKNHTYFVGESGVWVHNTGNPCDQAFDLFVDGLKNGKNEADALRDAFKHIRNVESSDVLVQKHLDDLLAVLDKERVPVKGLKNGKLAGLPHPKTGVVFDLDGFPIFESHGNAKLPGRMIGKHVTDKKQFQEASRQLWEEIKDDDFLKEKFTTEQLRAIKEGKEKIPGYTWHHHQDGVTMQLVDHIEHSLTGHSGGRFITGGRS